MASLTVNTNSPEASSSKGVLFEALGIEGIIAGISRSDTPILIVGESGAGKDFLAEEIHRISAHALRPFVKLDCSTVRPAELSAYVDQLAGAGREGPGTAGTIFVEDVADLEASLQAQLLLVWRENAGRSGKQGNGVHPARLICATRRNLEETVGQFFNEELYHRISRVCLRVPPLRHRREDIPALFNYFVSKYSQEAGHAQPEMTKQLLDRAESYSWPGNVRELKQVAYQLAVTRDIPDGGFGFFAESGNAPTSVQESSFVSLKDAAREASRRTERALILKTLTRTGWNRKRAAHELRISYKALLYKLKDISLEESARQG